MSCTGLGCLVVGEGGWIVVLVVGVVLLGVAAAGALALVVAATVG
jgi:Sec-independent protein translocase protein TatA